MVDCRSRSAERGVLLVHGFISQACYAITFITDEVLSDPALRQAYDHFGHSAVTFVLHNRYALDSLYRNLSALHADGKSSEALELLLNFLEESKRKQRQREWDFNADVEVNMHACSSDEFAGKVESFEISSTSVSVAASVPTQAAQSSGNQSLKRKQKPQLSIGGQSNIENGKGSTQGMLSINYQPVPQTNISSELTLGRKHLATSLSSSTQLANGTGLSIKMSRQFTPCIGNERKVAFGFSSHRSLTLFHGRVVQAMFVLGGTTDLRFHHGILSLTTWGFRPACEKDNPDSLPRLSAKLHVGTQFPIECSIDQSNLFNCPHRFGRAAVAWSPILGYRLKGLITRNLSQISTSQFTPKLGIGVEHSRVAGFKWLLSYQRPEGLHVRIPIFISRILLPGYWNKVIWVSALSYLVDETIGEWIGHSSPGMIKMTANTHMAISKKLVINQKEQQWLSSLKAKKNAERQLSMMVHVAKMKRKCEQASCGLVIIQAVYSSETSLKKASLDVTQQVQFWVENSQLHLPACSKRELLGFYDLTGRDHHTSDMLLTSKVNKKQPGTFPPPSDRLIHRMNLWLSWLGFGGDDTCPQMEKEDCTDDNAILTVRYKYKEQIFELSVKDDDELELPSTHATVLGPGHLVS